MMIKSRDPVREAFSGWSSGTVYYETKGDAVYTFDHALADYGYHLDLADCMDWYYDEGRKIVRILDENDDLVGHACFTWYRMQSGRWEVIGYIT